MAPVLFVRFTPKPGQAAPVQALLQGMVSPTRSEPGCRRYDLFRGAGPSGDAVLFLIEHFVDEAALQAHRDTAHYKEYRANVMDMLERAPEVQMLDAIDAKPY
jgi:quinol monooxygenase YgiN